MGYAELMRSWKADPEAFWMEAARDIDWIRAPSKALNATTRRSTTGTQTVWSTPATTRSTGMSTPGTATASRSSMTARSPAPSTRSPMPSCRPGSHRWPGRCVPRASKRATGSSSTCRWFPRRSRRCWPVPGWERSIRWCSAGSPPTNWPCASTIADPRRSSRRPAVWSRVGSSATNRCSTGPSRWPRTNPTSA